MEGQFIYQKLKRLSEVKAILKKSERISFYNYTYRFDASLMLVLQVSVDIVDIQVNEVIVSGFGHDDGNEKCEGAESEE